MLFYSCVRIVGSSQSNCECIAGIYKYLLTHSEAYKEYVNRNAESNKKEDL